MQVEFLEAEIDVIESALVVWLVECLAEYDKSGRSWGEDLRITMIDKILRDIARPCSIVWDKELGKNIITRDRKGHDNR